MLLINLATPSILTAAQEGASPVAKASPVPATAAAGKRGAKKQRVTTARSDDATIAAGISVACAVISSICTARDII
jgi:hypothetical protein